MFEFHVKEKSLNLISLAGVWQNAATAVIGKARASGVPYHASVRRAISRRRIAFTPRVQIMFKAHFKSNYDHL